MFQHKEKISDISSQASNEATLEQMLQKVYTEYFILILRRLHVGILVVNVMKNNIYMLF